MKIRQFDQLLVTSSPKVRGGSGHSSRIIFDSDILNRDPNRLDNFFLQISSLEEGEFHSPRHRHNFEQYRYMIKGQADYPEGKLTDGVLGYFPEGAYYGPQQNITGDIVIVQFGGASGSGFVDRKQMKTAFQELQSKNVGVFKDGTFYRNSGAEGTQMQDGNEAIFEQIHQRPMVYPAAQYATPILMDTNAHPWMPLEGIPGVAERALGTFSSCKFRAACYKLDAGAKFVAAGRGVYMVLSGKGALESEPYSAFTSIYLEDGEQAAFTASDTTEIILFGLPSMALMGNALTGILSSRPLPQVS